MKRKKKSKAIEWYIRGEYHCDKCPFCFGGEYLPGCDDYEDAGCYIFGDLRDTCRLIPPIRFILGWGKPFTRTFDRNSNNKLTVTEKLFTYISPIWR